MHRFNTISILKLSTIALFLGRAYQHIFWDAPYRTFLWDKNLLGYIVENIFNITWNNYVTNLAISNSIVVFIKIIGIFYLLCAIATFYITPTMKKLGKFFLIGGGLGLFILAFLYSKDNFFHVGQFFEYTAQFMSPVLLYLLMFSDVNIKKIYMAALISIMLTFSCHGLYAIGYYPQPGHFTTMILNILPVTEPTAHLILKVAGILDFVIAILVFIPKVSKIALWYALVWGGLTAIARLVGHFHIDFIWNSFNQWTWEVLIRLPHSLIPLFVLSIHKKAHQIYSGH